MKHLVFLLVLLVAHSLAAQEEHKNYYEPDTIESGPSNSSSVNETPTKSRAKRDLVRHFESSTYQCGIRKSCYVSLKTCDVDPKTCNFVLSWDFDGDYVNFELTGLTYSWISVLFTDDQYLGDDNIVVCSRDPATERTSIDHYFKKKDVNQLYKLEPEDYLRNKLVSFDSVGIVSCKFSRTKASSSVYVGDLSKPQFIYVERGSPGELMEEKLNKRFQTSETKIDFGTTVSRGQVSQRSWLVKLHAVLGIIAWILLGSIGILLARYYKPLWPNQLMYSFRVWFSFHRTIMIFVTLLSLLSLLFAVIEMEWKWAIEGNNLIHSILGIIVVTCSCLNPILGFLRPAPESPLRCLFFWFHWFIGAIAYCLAVPCIFIGMDLSKSDLPNWCAWLLFAWVLFHILVEIILEVHYCCTFSQLHGNYNENNGDYDRIGKAPVKRTDPPGYRWKPALLFIYSLVTAMVVSALVIAIFLLDA